MLEFVPINNAFFAIYIAQRSPKKKHRKTDEFTQIKDRPNAVKKVTGQNTSL